MLLKNKLSIKYRIKKSKNKKNPTLFLMIHGYGSNENDLFSFEKDLPENFFIISIQGIYSISMNKYYWYDIDFTSNKKQYINITQAKNTIQKISCFIDEVIKKYQLNGNKVWICGFSQGAILSYAIALKNSDKITNVIALSGYLEKSFIPKTIKNIVTNNLKFFISHGKYDTIIPIELAQESCNFLKNYQNFSLHYKEYESGHTLNNSNYKDLINWIKYKNILK